MKRLFIAINLPRETKQRIHQELLLELPDQLVTVVPADKLHLTLKFFGEVPDTMVKEITNQLNSLNPIPSFEMELGEIGEFSGRVIWIGIENPTGELENIQEILGKGEKKFQAHLTLARNKKLSKKELKELIEKLKQKKFKETVLVSKVDLMESRFNGQEHLYSKLKSKELSVH